MFAAPYAGGPPIHALRFHLGLLPAIVLLTCPPVEAQQPLSTDVLLTGLRSVYSPSVHVCDGVKRMWLGGWLTEADVGPDQLYMSEQGGQTWTTPTPILWTNAGYPPGKKPGFHVNDPSIVQPPSTQGIDRSRWLYMYYTALDDRFASDTTLQTQRNVTGFASSIDCGRTWTDHGIIIDVIEGGDGFGAWSPSALVVGEEIWVYYHTGNPSFAQRNLFRMRLHANGSQKLSSPERLQFAVSESPSVVGSNLDVSRQGAQFVMVANTFDLRAVVRYVSHEGLSWVTHPQDVNPIVAVTPGKLILTPHVEPLAGDRYRLYFGLDEGNNSTSVHGWEFQAPPPLADTGPQATLSASPNPCFIASGADRCAVDLSWSVTGSPYPTAHIWVREQRSGVWGSETQVSCASQFTQRIDWIMQDRVYEFNLYPATDCTAAGRVLVNGQPALWKQLYVSGVVPSVSFSASTTSCTATTTTACSPTPTLSWTVTGPVQTQVWVSDNGGSEALFGCGLAVSNTSTPAIYGGHTYAFHLYPASGCGTSEVTKSLWGQVTITGVILPSADLTVNLSASPATITVGQSSTLSWTSTNATSCTASGGWSGTKATSGNQSVTPTSTTTYTLGCTGGGSSVSQQVTVTVGSDGSMRYLVGVNYHATTQDFHTTDLFGTGLLGSAFIRQYHYDVVRGTVQAQLKTFADAGAGLIKTNLWLVDDPANRSNEAWRFAFPVTPQELQNLREYATDVANTRSVDGRFLELDFTLGWLGCANYHHGVPSTTVGDCQMSWNDFLTHAQETLNGLLNSVGTIRRADSQLVVKHFYLDGEVMVGFPHPEKMNTEAFLLALYPFFVQQATALGITPAVYFQTEFEAPGILDDNFVPPEPALRNHRSIAWLYRSVEFLRTHGLPIPPRLDISFYPTSPTRDYATLIRRVWDDLQAVYPEMPVGVVETLYPMDPTDRQAFGQTFANEFQARGMPRRIAFWTTPDGGSWDGGVTRVNGAFPFDLSAYLLPDSSSLATIVAYPVRPCPEATAPNECTTVAWTTPGLSMAQVWVSENGAVEQQMACAPLWAQPIPWIAPGHTYVFRLYAASSCSNDRAALIGDPRASVTVQGTSALPGDLNGDEKRSLADVRLMIYMLIDQQPVNLTTADLTGDNRCTLADLQALIKLLVFSPTPASA